MDAQLINVQRELHEATSRVLQLVERLPGLNLPSLETVVTVGGPSPVELPWRTLTMDELLDGAGDERPTLPRVF